MQQAIDSAVDGDTVTIPAGSCTWTTPVTVDKSITLLGAGIGVTNITANAVSAVAPGWGQYVGLIWTTKATGNSPPGFSRLSGFTFHATAGCSNGDQGGIILFQGMSKNIRVDHNRINSTTCNGLRTDGAVAGVVDHNTFDNSAFLSHSTAFQHQSWDGVGDYGHKSWASDSTIGTANALYFEDNVLNNTLGTGQELYATNDDKGARTVYRFNRFNSGAYATHGTETGGTSRGFRHAELYRNTFAWAIGNFPSVIGFRGGTGMVFENIATGSLQMLFSVSTLRRDDPWSSHPGQYPYGKCGILPVTSMTRSGSTITVTAPNHYIHSSGSYIVISGASQSEFNGTFVGRAIDATRFTYQASGTSSSATGTITVRSPFDGNNGSTGYRCMDQAGAGKGILLTGDGPNSTDISPLGPVNNALEPIYAWGNLLNGSQSNTTVVSGHDVVLANREFYNFTSAFNGSSGIGTGSLSARPSTCTTGVAYWATDQGAWNATGPDGVLFKCTATNTWALFYTPYAYPHPLVGDGPAPVPPAAPTNLRIVP